MSQIIFIIGVSGSGKTTIGQLLAKQTGFPFFDADEYHPVENLEKMKAGIPLNDLDRLPWLKNLNELAKRSLASSGAIITCSALKKKYREKLEEGMVAKPHWVFLNGSFELILARMNERKGHFMPASLLRSQFDALEIPDNAFEIDIEKKPATIINEIMNKL